MGEDDFTIRGTSILRRSLCASRAAAPQDTPIAIFSIPWRIWRFVTVQGVRPRKPMFLLCSGSVSLHSLLPEDLP